jgi:hypothetical protein
MTQAEELDCEAVFELLESAVEAARAGHDVAELSPALRCTLTIARAAKTCSKPSWPWPGALRAEPAIQKVRIMPVLAPTSLIALPGRTRQAL